MSALFGVLAGYVADHLLQNDLRTVKEILKFDAVLEFEVTDFVKFFDHLFDCNTRLDLVGVVVVVEEDAADRSLEEVGTVRLRFLGLR